MIEIRFYNAISPRGLEVRYTPDVDSAQKLQQHFSPFNNTRIMAYVVNAPGGERLAEVDLGPLRGCPCGDPDGSSCAGPNRSAQPAARYAEVAALVAKRIADGQWYLSRNVGRPQVLRLMQLDGLVELSKYEDKVRLITE